MEQAIWWAITILKGCISGNPVDFLRSVTQDGADALRDKILGWVPDATTHVLDVSALEKLGIPQERCEMVSEAVKHVLKQIDDPTKYGYMSMGAAKEFVKEHCAKNQYSDEEMNWIACALEEEIKGVLIRLKEDLNVWCASMDRSEKITKKLAALEKQINLLIESCKLKEATDAELIAALNTYCEKQIYLAQNSTFAIEKVESVLFPSIIDERNVQFLATEDQTALFKKLKEDTRELSVAAENRHLLLVGEGGGGKTVTMLATCNHLIKQKCLALYIPLRCMNKPGSSIERYISHDIFCDESRLVNYFRSQLTRKLKGDKSPRIYFFIDGLNELNQEVRQCIWNEIRMLSQVECAKVVLASRRTPEAERLYNLCFRRLDIARLPWHKVVRYLELHQIAIPSMETMGDILGVPLMLKAYAYVQEQTQTLCIASDPCMEWKKPMSNSNVILWNYVQCQIYQAFQNDNSYDLQDYVVAGEYMAPFLASKMNGEGVYTEKEDIICHWLGEGLNKLNSAMPNRIDRVNRHNRRRSDRQPDRNDIYKMLLYDLNLLTRSETGDISFKHQEFQDSLHFIYLENSFMFPDELFYENAYITHKLPYDVLTLMSHNFSEATISALHDRITLNPGEYGVYNLIEIIKRKRNYDLSGIDLSGLDLTCVNLQNTKLSNSTTKKATLFRNTIIGNDTFSSHGHSAAVTSVDCSPSGGKIVSGSYDNTLRIWNAETGEHLGTLEGHTHYVRCVAWAPTETLVASGGDDKTLKIWAVEENPIQHISLKGHTGWVYSVAWDKDAKHLISGDSRGKLILWEHTNGQWHKALSVSTRYSQKINSIAWSPTEKSLVAVGAANGTLFLFNIQTGKHLQILFSKGICALAWSLDGTRIAVAAGDGLYICDTERLKTASTGTYIEAASPICLALLKGAATTISSVVWFANCLAEARGNTIRLWDIEKILGGSYSGKTIVWADNLSVCLDTLDSHTDHVNCLSRLPSAPNQKAIVSCSDDCTLRIWKARSPSWNTSWNCTRIFGGEQTPARCTAWSPDGKWLAAGYDDCIIRIWDISTGAKPRCIKALYGHTSRIKCLAWGKDNQTLVSGANDKTVRLWDVSTGKCSKIMARHTGAINCILWPQNASWIISGSDDNTILLWNIKKQTFKQLVGHTDSVYSIALSSDGTRLVSGSNDKYIRIWDLSFDKDSISLISPSISWQAHEKPIRCVAWIPTSGGTMVISGSNDGLLKRWHIDGTPWDETPELSGHSDFVYCCAVSPDGKYIVSGSTDKTLCIWEPVGGELLQKLTDHTSFIWGVAWAREQISSASSDGTIRIWDARNLAQIPSPQVLQAFSGVNLIDCDFQGAKFETEKLCQRIKMNGGFLGEKDLLP